MKARNLLKLLFTAMAAFAFTGTYAQHTPFTDMSADTTVTDSIVNGAKMIYFVEPDNVLNNLTVAYDTSWTQAQANTNGVYSNWSFNWENGTGIGTIWTPTVWANAPYRVIRYSSTGSDNLQATESSAGGCAGNTASLPIEVIPQPSFTVFDGTQNTKDDTLEICNGQPFAAGDFVINTIANDGIANSSSYKLLMDITKDRLNNDYTVAGNVYSHPDSVLNFRTADGNNIEIGTLLGYDPSMNNGQITRYQFDLRGINNHISRKSDYLGFAGAIGGAKTKPSTDLEQANQYTWYSPTTDATEGYVYTVLVYPRPTTGNIYHLPNDYDL